MSMREVTYWVIRYTDLHGKRQEYGGRTPMRCSTREGATEVAADMEDWQAAEVIQIWEYR